jgi:WD40 repeat protein
LSHDAAVRTVVFSPDGRQLATADDDGILHIWDTSTGHELHQLRGHTSGIFFTQFSANGQYLVSSGRDNNVIVWDLQIGEPVRHFHLPPVASVGHVVAFGPDGHSLFIQRENGLMTQVDLMLKPGELLNWIQRNRYVRDLTCTERELYRLEPLCDASTT